MSENAFSNDLKKFLQQLAKRNKWKGLNGEDNAVWAVGRDIGIAARSPGNYIVEIIFSHHKHEGVYLLSKFAIKPENGGLLQGIEVLRHLGKRQYSTSDGTDPLKGEVYEVRRPADIEALLREYDKLAQFNNIPTIFNLP